MAIALTLRVPEYFCYTLANRTTYDVRNLARPTDKTDYEDLTPPLIGPGGVCEPAIQVQQNK